MTVYKLVENHQTLYGQLNWKTLRNLEMVSPLLSAFVRDGSIFFALFVFYPGLSCSSELIVHTYYSEHLVRFVVMHPDEG